MDRRAGFEALSEARFPSTASTYRPSARIVWACLECRDESHLSVDAQTGEKARRVAQAMHKCLNHVVRKHLQQLAGQDQLDRDAEGFRRLSG